MGEGLPKFRARCGQSTTTRQSPLQACCCRKRQPSALPGSPPAAPAARAAVQTGHRGGIHAPSRPAPKSCSRPHQPADHPASAGSDPGCSERGKRTACRLPISTGPALPEAATILLGCGGDGSSLLTPPPSLVQAKGQWAGMFSGNWRSVRNPKTPISRAGGASEEACRAIPPWFRFRDPTGANPVNKEQH
jgi:hypothetical protein